jgi:hypothetical protein
LGTMGDLIMSIHAKTEKKHPPPLLKVQGAPVSRMPIEVQNHESASRWELAVLQARNVTGQRRGKESRGKRQYQFRLPRL